MSTVKYEIRIVVNDEPDDDEASESLGAAEVGAFEAYRSLRTRGLNEFVVELYEVINDGEDERPLASYTEEGQQL